MVCCARRDSRVRRGSIKYPVGGSLMSARSRMEIANNAANILKNDDFWLCTSTYSALKAMHGGVSSTLMALSNVAPINLTVPGSILVTDTISPPGDTDVFGISVVAGRTYMISLYGSGATPLQDPLVALIPN